MRNMDIEAWDTDQLGDLRSVSIDRSLPVPERMSSFVEQVKNPYLFKVDDITVKVEFSSGKRLRTLSSPFCWQRRADNRN